LLLALEDEQDPKKPQNKVVGLIFGTKLEEVTRLWFERTA